MIENHEIKQQVKEALFEFFSKDNVFLRDLVSELMEEIAFSKAIKEGDVGDYIDEESVINALKSEYQNASIV